MNLPLMSLKMPHQRPENLSINSPTVTKYTPLEDLQIIRRFSTVIYFLNGWSSSNAFVSGARGLRFKSPVGQIGPGVVNRFATPVKFLRKELCCPDTMTRRWPPQTRYSLRRNTTSIDLNFHSARMPETGQLVERQRVRV